MVNIDGSGGGYDDFPFYFVGYLAGVGTMSEIDTLKDEYRKLVGMCESLQRYVVLEAEVYNKIGPVLVDYAIVDKDPLYVLKKHLKMEKRRKEWL